MTENALNELIGGAVCGDMDAVVSLCEAVASRILFKTTYFLRTKEDAEDVAQEVMLRLCKNIKQLNKEEMFHVWLNSIIKNEINRYMQKHYKEKNALRAELPEPMKNLLIEETEKDCLPDECAMEKELSREIFEMIGALPLRQKEAVCLYFYDNLSTVEVAKVMRISQQAVVIHLNRAKEKLRKQLEEHEKFSGRVFSMASVAPMLPWAFLAEEEAFLAANAQATERILRPCLSYIKTGVYHGGVSLTSFLNLPLLSGVLLAVGMSAFACVSAFGSGGHTDAAPGGEIVYEGGECECGHVNPDRLALYIQGDKGEIASVRWEIWNEAGTVLTRGEGDTASAGLGMLQSEGMTGEFEVHFRVETRTKSMTDLTRKFNIT